MEIDEVIDMVAFGATTPRVSSSLGLYLSPETIYVAETRMEKGGRLAVEHLARIPVPAPEAKEGAKAPAGPSTGTLNTDFLMDNAKLSALIRQSMSQIRWGTKNVVVTLSHHLGLLRYFTMPAIDRRFWKTAVPLEAKRYIPIPFDVLNYDYQVVPISPDATGKPRQAILIGVTQRKNIANIAALLEGLDLNLVGMEVAPCSVLRLWEAIDRGDQGQPYCQVHFDGGNIRILLADKGLPVFFRELFLGPEASLADLRKVDLSGCAAFTQKLLAVEPVSRVRVSGTTPELPRWQEAFSSELGVEATLQDTAGMLGIKAGDWGGYAAIGSSLRFLQPTTMTLDVGRVSRIADDERRAALGILVFSAVLALWFAAVGLFRASVYQFKSRELLKYKREPEIQAVFAGKSAEEIEKLLKDMQAQMAIAQGLGAQSSKVTALLKDVAESLPERVWVTGIDLSNPMAKGLQALELHITGHAVGNTPAQEQDLVFQFRERLSKSPAVGRIFPDITVSVSAKDLPLETSQGLDPGALARRLEERTTFTIIARARQA